MKNVVVIGGGTGLSTLLKGLKNIDNINLSAIVTVADDGGSTGILRKEFNLPAMGDLRKVILSLSSNESLFDKIMNYRFKENKTFLDNHSLGNIIITALIDIEKDFYLGIKKLKDFLNLKGEVIPVSNNPLLTLKAVYTDNSFAIGESNIPNPYKKIKHIEYVDNNHKTNTQAIQKILEADFIVFSMGSLYTSLIANLIIPEIKQAILENTKAEVIYVCNVMTQNGETHNMQVSDHIDAINHHLKNNVIKKVILNNNKNINQQILKRYQKQNSFICENDLHQKKCEFEIIEQDILDNNSYYIRHDFKKIENIFSKLIKNN